MTVENDRAAYRTTRRRTKHPMNFEVDDERRQDLRETAAARGISMGATLRQLIDAAHSMDCDNIPTCANGRQCLVPHLHPQAPSRTIKEQPSP